MKKYFLLLGLSIFTIDSFCQDAVVSAVSLTLKSGDSNSKVFAANGIFSVNDDTQIFTARLELFPILSDTAVEDSLEQIDKPLILTLNGQFPVNNMDFETIGDNGSSYIMEVQATLNDSVQKFPLNFFLVIPRDAKPISNATMPVYPARMRFECLLLPEQYGLNNIPFNINNAIRIYVTDAVINKF